MTLGKHATTMRRILSSLNEDTVRSESAPSLRATQSDVERLVSAMLNGSQVGPRVKAILGKDADVVSALESLSPAVHTVVAQWIISQGGKVGGSSASSVKAALRGMSQGEDEESGSVPLE